MACWTWPALVLIFLNFSLWMLVWEIKENIYLFCFINMHILLVLAKAIFIFGQIMHLRMALWWTGHPSRVSFLPVPQEAEVSSCVPLILHRTSSLENGWMDGFKNRLFWLTKHPEHASNHLATTCQPSTMQHCARKLVLHDQESIAFSSENIKSHKHKL